MININSRDQNISIMCMSKIISPVETIQTKIEEVGHGRLSSTMRDCFNYVLLHVHDIHASILHLLGMDHERLTYRYAGRDYRLTDVHGRVPRAIVA